MSEITPANSSEKLIYLVENDLHRAGELAKDLSYYDYMVRLFLSPAALVDAIAQQPPAAILSSVDFPEGNRAGIVTLAEIQAQREEPFPVIFLADEDDIFIRLQAVRAGSRAFFVRPVDLSALVDALDQFTNPGAMDPYRVLIMDDQRLEANYHMLALRQAGMQVQVVLDPRQLLSALNDFAPDLVLLDMYMPEIGGMELAKVLRQIESFVSVPIVFLSSEDDRSVQLQAIGLGGDDFISKTSKPAYIIEAVRSRAERYRRLRSLMVHDGLTGLFNHTTTREYLEKEVERARRLETPLAFSMLDLDHFKRINDTYGHPAGDRRLKTLSLFLKQRLRRSDILGRYGGDEFAMILPDTSARSAMKLLEELRFGFNQLPQRPGEEETPLTFSCGVAGFPEYSGFVELSDAADKALYTAKRRGRNQVVLAEGPNIEANTL